MNVLDKLPPYVRHLVFALVSALLAWAGTDLVPVLKDQPGWGAVAASFVTVLVAALLPVTRQYGVGARKAEGD